MRAWAAIALALAAGGPACRVEVGAPGRESRGAEAQGSAPRGEVWIYTSLYQYVVDDLDRLAISGWPEGAEGLAGDVHRARARRRIGSITSAWRMKPRSLAWEASVAPSVSVP